MTPRGKGCRQSWAQLPLEKRTEPQRLAVITAATRRNGWRKARLGASTQFPHAHLSLRGRRPRAALGRPFRGPRRWARPPAAARPAPHPPKRAATPRHRESGPPPAPLRQPPLPQPPPHAAHGAAFLASHIRAAGRRAPRRSAPTALGPARPGRRCRRLAPRQGGTARHGTAPPSRREGRRRHGRPRPRHAPAARSRARRSPRRGRRPYAAPAPAATAERRLASSRAGGALVAARGCTKREARPLSRPAPLPPRRTSGAASSVQTAAPTSPAALLIPPSEGRAPAGNTYVKSEGSDPRRPRRARGTFPELARCAARAAFHAPLTSPNSLTRPAAPLRTASKAPGIHPP